MARILVVDDEESIRFTFQSFLSAKGHEVDTAEGFDQAVGRHGPQSPGFGLRGPDSGEPAGYRASEAHPGPRHQLPGHRHHGRAQRRRLSVEALRLGAFGYAPKPIHRDTLLAFTDIALKHKKLADEKQALSPGKGRPAVAPGGTYSVACRIPCSPWTPTCA